MSEFRLSTFNKVKSHWANQLGKPGDVSTEDMEKLIAFWESANYTKEGNQYHKECPESYRDEFVAWLREEYL